MTEETIQEIIGGPLSDPAMLVKDYASQNGLDFAMISLPCKLR
jgi:hypothetical protein